ncbi:hypothetical protein ACIO93_33915 [Streptomyces sp. NPDC087903]|uniref:hypothetical protein n=1 Tax=Streptomyces sp. NPDC087903 TaxID=3365819 RepID=UPI0038221AA3
MELALELGVPSGRINPIIGFPGAPRHGTKAEDSAAASSADVLHALATLIAQWGSGDPHCRRLPAR